MFPGENRRRFYQMEYVEVPLTQGCVALIDAEDVERVRRYKWCAQKKLEGRQFYAVTSTPSPNRKRVLMHRMLLDAPPELDVDHINGNGLDNRKANLRLATRAQNCRNRGRLVAGQTSRFKGVCLHKRSGKWLAHISVEGKPKLLGRFVTEEEAAAAYDDAAVAIYGVFACTNAEALARTVEPS